jgi:hypothetical protein
MRFALGAAAILALLPVAGLNAQQYSNLNASEMQRLLNGTEEEKKAATFYIAGAMDTLALQSSILGEQGMPLFCPGPDADLRATALASMLQEHIDALSRRARSKDALDRLTAGTILTVMLSGEYPCQVEQPGAQAPQVPAP